jgi:RND family efflux transporter MFP subunit
MIRKYVLPLLSILGVIFGAYMVSVGCRREPVAGPVAEPSHAPFKSYVAGAGIIEAATENIAVATPVGGVATEIYVKVGDHVTAGQPLFKLDDRNLRATLAVEKAQIDSAQAKLNVDIASLNDLQNQLDFYQSVSDTRAVSREELDRKKFAAETGKAHVASSRADVAAAQAQAAATQVDIERLTVTAPVTGQVLQVNLRLGEYADAGPMSTALMLLGNVDELHVRVDVDENDAWRVSPTAPAIAFVRGNPQLSTPLRLVRIEPYVIPKKSLTGDTTERVDTRVLQVIYAFDRTALPVYVGQQMDVYIEAPNNPDVAPAGPAGPTATVTEGGHS